MTLSREVRDRFLEFAHSPEARWTANFRDLNAAVTRMATLAEGGRITAPVLEDELARLRGAWAEPQDPGSDTSVLEAVVGAKRLAEIDPFDQVQLAHVIGACRESDSQSDAGRRLFRVSRLRRRQTNDADRLGKYLARFGLTWAECRGK